MRRVPEIDNLRRRPPRHEPQVQVRCAAGRAGPRNGRPPGRPLFPLVLGAVIRGALCGITQDIVCMLDSTEFFVRGARAGVRVVPSGQKAVRRAHLPSVRVRLESEDLVGIVFHRTARRSNYSSSRASRPIPCQRPVTSRQSSVNLEPGTGVPAEGDAPVAADAQLTDSSFLISDSRQLAIGH